MAGTRGMRLGLTLLGDFQACLGSAALRLRTRKTQALLAYLVSDDHLSMRRSLGYSIEVELDITDVEEIA